MDSCTAFQVGTEGRARLGAGSPSAVVETTGLKKACIAALGCLD
jgi:hypothetical protein